MIFQYRGCLLIGQNVQLSISKKNFGMNRMIEVRLKYAKMLRNVVFVETKQKMKEQSFGGILLSESITGIANTNCNHLDVRSSTCMTDELLSWYPFLGYRPVGVIRSAEWTALISIIYISCQFRPVVDNPESQSQYCINLICK